MYITTKKLRKPEYYTKHFVIDPDFKVIILKIQKDAYNQGIKDSANSAKLKCEIGCSGEFSEHLSVDKNSILKLKIK